MGFSEHLQIVTTRNYSALTNSCTLLLTTAHTKSAQFAMLHQLLCGMILK
jgi:hypothetical protein